MLDLLSLFLLLVSLVLDLLISLGDLGLEGGYAFDLSCGHAYGGTDRGRLLEDLVVSLLALLDI